MKRTFYSFFLLALFGMTGMNAWADDLTTTEIDGVTYYEIDDAADLMALADSVNNGQTGANAILTADIDMTGIAEDAWVAIGDWHADGIGYKAHFNGQGHTIKNFNFTATHNYFALFGIISTGALIENFTIEGSITVDNENFGYVAGIAAYIRDKTPTIRNVHSKVDINSTSTAGTPRLGGIAGGVPGQNSTAIIDRCTYSGTLNANDKGGNYGGIVGYILNNANVTADITSCLFDGKIKSVNNANSAQLGGIIGYTRKGIVSVKNCLSVGTIEFDEADVSNVGQFVGRITYDSNTTGLTFTNNFYKNTGIAVYGSSSGGPGNGTAPVEATAEQFASGEVCYLLNGDQEVISFYQTLDGSDEYPVLDATHKQVFMNGRLHCNGDVYEGATFSNEDAGVIQDEHDFVDGFCSYCGLFDENYLTPNADGFYEIAKAKDLVWFEQLVNKGNFEVNAVLTADIDFADLMPEDSDPEETEVEWTAIGDWGGVRGTSNARYMGHFDGQGHTIRNFNVSSNANYYGIFGVLSEGSLVENFDIYGTMNLGHKTGGVIGYTRDTSCTIRNIHSYLTLNVTEKATSAERPGGILGTAVNGTTNVENCTYSGILNVGGHTGNIGGIVGYVNNSSTTIVNITNCLFDGEIQNGSEADGQCGGIVGYNNAGTLTIKNCLSIGTIVSSEENIGQFIGRLNGGNTTFANLYYKGEFINGTKSGANAKGTAPTEVGTEELYSGEVCWKLNEETFLNPAWRQTLNEDDYPLPYGNGAIVYQTPDGYECFSPDNPESFESFRDGIIANENNFIRETVAYQPLLNEYANNVQSWTSIDNFDDFMAAYQASYELKESIKTSAANYAAYVKVCEEAAAYMEDNHLEGEYANILKTYLENNIAPNSTYPNGSFLYIMENRSLNDEKLAEEMTLVDLMLQNALAGGITAGTEITRLMVNPTFAEGSKGWTIETQDGVKLTTGGTTSIMRITQGLGKGTFNIAQTMNELPNGIYMIDLNGIFRAGSSSGNYVAYYNPFYAGQLYLNNTYNYVMAPGEDVIDDDHAEDKVNCLIASDFFYEDDPVGYVPSNMAGCSYAFNAGRYKNFCATEVTDSTLTIGVRNLGTGLDDDWLPFGNMHVYYLGTANEANQKLTDVLKGYVQRAKTIEDYYWSDDPADFFMYPNFSNSLMTQLNEAIAAAANAATGSAKMDLINDFSDLFNQIHASRMAYIAMYDAANKLYNSLDVLQEIGVIDDDEYEEWKAEAEKAQEYFINGDISTDEALALADKLDIIGNLLPKVDGIYQLSTAQQVKLFAMKVNTGGESDAKAIMVDDIDFSETDYFDPIGTADMPFKGEFDGQGHKITNFGQYIVEEGEEGEVVEGYYTWSFAGNCKGFFGSVNGATIKNFSIEGAFEATSGKYIGAIGQSQNSTISNVHSSLNINVNASGLHHTGGVVGSTEPNANSTIIGCTFAGTLKVAAGSTDNFAGVVGYLGGDRVMNCANYGTITFDDTKCAAGGVAGYLNNTTTYIQNCMNVGTVHCTISDSPDYGGAIIGRIKNNWSSERVVNNYWLEGSAYAPAKKDDGTSPAAGTSATAEQMASGEICYKLNGDQQEIVWFQTLPNPQDETVVADPYPVLFGDHLVVWPSINGGYTNNEADEINEIQVAEQPAQFGIYNLAGQRLEKMQKGINIVNGKKVLVK